MRGWDVQRVALQGLKVGHGKSLQDSHFKIDPKVGLDRTAEVHVVTEEQCNLRQRECGLAKLGAGSRSGASLGWGLGQDWHNTYSALRATNTYRANLQGTRHSAQLYPIPQGDGYSVA